MAEDRRCRSSAARLSTHPVRKLSAPFLSSKGISMISTLARPLANTLDLRDIAPRDRQTTVCAVFDTLQAGQSLQILNGHDPQPLRRQLEERSSGAFEWLALETEPAVWRVQVTRLVGSGSARAPDSCCSGGACCG
jgi:uncharacterized protein (DUF2249 family)